MKKLILPLFLLCFATTALAAGTVFVSLAWEYAPTDSLTNYIFKLYTSPNPAPTNGVLVVTVIGVTNVTVSVPRPSEQYFWATAAARVSNETNYTADSEPSNLVRVRVLGNGNLKVLNP